MTQRAARFGVGSGTLVDELDFGNDVALDGSTIISGLADAIPPLGADLLEIATVSYAVDRMIRRPTQRQVDRSGDWGRDIWVEVAVREPGVWRRHERSLSALLHWLTDDQWMLEFVQLDPGRGPLDATQGVLFDTLPSGIPPILFSGGLDSACGLYLDLLDHDALTVSVDTNTWMHFVQHRVLSGLASITSRKIAPLRYKVNLPRGGVESSQRTRGFLFLSAGVSAALAVRSCELVVAENGIGSINLPYVRSQLGAQATRSMHPRTVTLIESLVTKIIGHQFSIRMPYRGLTKAELLTQIPRDADRILAQTVSCDTGFAARVKDHNPCGRCTSCLLRRQAIHGAGRRALEAGVAYRYPAAGSDAMSAMLWQVMRLRKCLAVAKPWLGLVEEFPEIGHAQQYMTPEEIVRLYGRYVEEWDLLMEAVPVGNAWSFGRDGV